MLFRQSFEMKKKLKDLNKMSYLKYEITQKKL